MRRVLNKDILAKISINNKTKIEFEFCSSRSQALVKSENEGYSAALWYFNGIIQPISIVSLQEITGV